MKKISLKNIILEEINNLNNDDIIYHGSDKFIDKFDLSNIKGNARAIHGWGIYFANTIPKALDYGDNLTIVNKKNLNLLKLTDNITDEFIEKYNHLFNNDHKLKNYSKYNNFDSISELTRYKWSLEDKLKNIRNNNDYDNINNVIVEINNILDQIDKPKTRQEQTYEYLFNILEKNIGAEFNNTLTTIRNNHNVFFDKELSLMFAFLGFDGFNYMNYEYVIFNINNINIVNHINKKDISNY